MQRSKPYWGRVHSWFVTLWLSLTFSRELMDVYRGGDPIPLLIQFGVTLFFAMLVAAYYHRSETNGARR